TTSSRSSPNKASASRSPSTSPSWRRRESAKRGRKCRSAQPCPAGIGSAMSSSPASAISRPAVRAARPSEAPAPGIGRPPALMLSLSFGGVSVMRFLLKPLQYWVWSDSGRRAQRLLHFAEVEADGGRDLVRAAELTDDPRLRMLYLRHARDEQRHADIFRKRGLELLRAAPGNDARAPRSDWLTPGERGL